MHGIELLYVTQGIDTLFFADKSPLDYSQCIPGAATASATSSSAPASTSVPAGFLPRLGGVNTAGYDFSVVSCSDVP